MQFFLKKLRKTNCRSLDSLGPLQVKALKGFALWPWKVTAVHCARKQWFLDPTFPCSSVADASCVCVGGIWAGNRWCWKWKRVASGIRAKMVLTRNRSKCARCNHRDCVGFVLDMNVHTFVYTFVHTLSFKNFSQAGLLRHLLNYVLVHISR